MSWDCFSWFSFIYLHNVPYVTVLFVAVCSSLLGSSFCPCSGRRSLWRWSRRCRLQRRCSGRSSLSPASHGSCGLRSVPQRSGSARTCSSRSATPCTASWTWCALVSRGASVLSVCVCVCEVSYLLSIIVWKLNTSQHKIDMVTDLYKSGNGYKIDEQ